ncbi:hypothetical protein SAMN04489806_0238 [Paramicrobacterium humi]|uniref:Uncharacterized protein n=1 Tax=Paramicrobacterium humi TaxID=640635 RepID=A0A1H4IV48_9MICO|nr:hypothetical protein [Microbacterium humi]SEB37178.1 hypothetical protein SAMN04489806_0238 [Microbacterium humi]
MIDETAVVARALALQAKLLESSGRLEEAAEVRSRVPRVASSGTQTGSETSDETDSADVVLVERVDGAKNLKGVRALVHKFGPERAKPHGSPHSKLWKSQKLDGTLFVVYPADSADESDRSVFASQQEAIEAAIRSKSRPFEPR